MAEPTVTLKVTIPPELARLLPPHPLVITISRPPASAAPIGTAAVGTSLAVA